MNRKFRTKKLHISITEDMFEKLSELKVMSNIDGIVSDLLISHFHLDEEVEE